MLASGWTSQERHDSTFREPRLVVGEKDPSMSGAETEPGDNASSSSPAHFTQRLPISSLSPFLALSGMRPQTQTHEQGPGLPSSGGQMRLLGISVYT